MQAKHGIVAFVVPYLLWETIIIKENKEKSLHSTHMVAGDNMYQLKTEAYFDSAHFLADYHGKCENIHGHRWRVVAYIEKESLHTEGTMRDMVCDFSEFKQALNETVQKFDHTFLVEEGTLAQPTIEALENEGFSLTLLPMRTTAENLAHLIFEQLCTKNFNVNQVDVYETPLNCATYIPKS